MTSIATDRSARAVVLGPGPASDTMGPPGSERAPPGRLTVLVVDDDPLLAEFLGFEIETLDCEVHVAGSGEEALALLGGRDIHMVITDWQMPGMDGMELARRARAARPTEHLHIVMMTGREDEAAIRTAMEAGVDDFLYKPVQSVQIELAIASARRNRALHRRLAERNAALAQAHASTRAALDAVRADLDAATRLHERLLPAPGRTGAIEVAHLYRPAAILGGDSLGVAPLGDGRMMFFLVDVCGHGVPAALDSFHLHHRIRQLPPAVPAEFGPEALGAAIGTINREIAARGDDSYATLVCGILDPAHDAGWLIRAGHPPPLIQTAGSRAPRLLEDDSASMPLGWFASTPYTAARFDFPAGSRLVLYSDGVTDCTSPANADSGAGVIAQILARHADAGLGTAIAAIDHELLAAKPLSGFADDISLLALARGASGDQYR